MKTDKAIITEFRDECAAIVFKIFIGFFLFVFLVVIFMICSGEQIREKDSEIVKKSIVLEQKKATIQDLEAKQRGRINNLISQLEFKERQIAILQLASILGKGPNSRAWWKEELSWAANCLPDGDEEKPCLENGWIRIRIVGKALRERICTEMVCAETTAADQGSWLLIATTEEIE
ncbi:MAG: hypothetical protein WCL30_02860 [Pseudomonadota bacterium]